MSKEAMKLALEALESLKVTVSSRTEANVIDGVDLFPTQIAALRKALANEALDKIAENARELGLDYEPAKQEPVAWVCYGSSDGEMHDIDFEQKDVDALPVGTMLYTFPPQRTWVGLTDDEIFAVCDLNIQGGRMRPYRFSRAIEAKLREKNT